MVQGAETADPAPRCLSLGNCHDEVFGRSWAAGEELVAIRRRGGEYRLVTSGSTPKQFEAELRSVAGSACRCPMVGRSAARPDWGAIGRGTNPLAVVSSLGSRRHSGGTVRVCRGQYHPHGDPDGRVGADVVSAHRRSAEGTPGTRGASEILPPPFGRCGRQTAGRRSPVGVAAHRFGSRKAGVSRSQGSSSANSYTGVSIVMLGF